MPLSTSAKNAMLDELATLAIFASLHSAYPGDSGASEISGGSPAYARKSVTWNAAASGNLDNNANPTFDVPAATTVAWIGLWSAVTVGTFYGSFPLAGGTVAPFETTASDDIFRVDQHGYSDGNAVVFYDASGAVLPTTVVEGTVYFVRDSTTDTFKIAATSGGAAIDITVDGAGHVQKIVTETFGSQGSLAVTDLDVSLNL